MEPEVAPHPNAPRRAALALVFVAVVLAGAFGGIIGWGIVDTSCSEQPTVARELFDAVAGYEAAKESCDLQLLGGALAGTVVAVSGAGIVGVLMLRAQSEWRAHPPPEGPA